MIYICSKQRPEMLVRSLGRYRAAGGELPVKVMVERDEVATYRAALGHQAPRWASEYNYLRGGQVVSMARRDQGLAYARRMACKDAEREGRDVIIMCDDDIAMPRNVYKLIKYMQRHPRAAGIGGWFPIYEHFSGIRPGTGIHESSGSMGKGCCAIRPGLVLALGGYKTVLRTHEDSDLILRLYREGYRPWSIHSDVQLQSLQKRESPGGISALVGRGSIEDVYRETFRALSREWGDLVSLTSAGKIRIQWAKARARYATRRPNTTASER